MVAADACLLTGLVGAVQQVESEHVCMSALASYNHNCNPLTSLLVVCCTCSAQAVAQTQGSLQMHA